MDAAADRSSRDYGFRPHHPEAAGRQAALSFTDWRRDISDSTERGLTVLVVDDDPDVVRVISLALKVKGFSVLEAFRGTEAVSRARRELPDAVVLDIMMPDIDGYEVYRRLKLDERTSHIPVVFVSAMTSSESINRGMMLGAQGYLTKPFKPTALAKAVQEAIERAGNAG